MSSSIQYQVLLAQTPKAVWDARVRLAQPSPCDAEPNAKDTPVPVSEVTQPLPPSPTFVQHLGSCSSKIAAQLQRGHVLDLPVSGAL